MNRPVASMPWPSFGALLSYSARPLPKPFDGPETTLWTSARIALWQAIQAFGLKPGQRVAVPAFCCGSELEPFLVAGLELTFFSVADDLSPDMDSFREAIEHASAAMATHYFGLPADLSSARDMARARGIPFIEDCAHALYATDGTAPIGTAGDAAIFSFWKTVAIPDGGALYLRTGNLPAVPNPPPADLISKATRHLVSRAMRSHSLAVVRGTEVLRQRIRKGAPAPQQDAPKDEWHLIKFPHELTGAGMSARSLRIFRATDHGHVRDIRRRRYRELESALAGIPGIRPMVPRLDDGACPLYFPALVENGSSLRRALAAESVGVKHIWPYFHTSVPWDRFPRERLWKEQAIGFPVHQSLSDGDMARLIGTITQWSRQ